MQRIQPTSCLADRGVQLIRGMLEFCPSIDGEIGYCDKNHEREGIEVTNYVNFLGQMVIEKRCGYDNSADLEASWLEDMTSDLHELLDRINLRGLRMKILGDRASYSMAGLARVRITNPNFISLDVDETNPAGVLRQYELSLQEGN